MTIACNSTRMPACVLRCLALLRGCSYRTGECFLSHEAIAKAAGCCIELRALEAAGIIQTIWRKVCRDVHQPGSPGAVWRAHSDEAGLEAQYQAVAAALIGNQPAPTRSSAWACWRPRTPAIP